MRAEESGKPEHPVAVPGLGRPGPKHDGIHLVRVEAPHSLRNHEPQAVVHELSEERFVNLQLQPGLDALVQKLRKDL